MINTHPVSGKPGLAPLPKGDTITDHQPYLNAIAEELNERPRRSLGYLTPREAFTRLLNTDTVATTP